MERHFYISLKSPGKIGSTTFRGLVQTASAGLLVILPKCSICLAAYLNIFSLLGLSVSKYASWILPVLCVVATSGLVMSFLKARKLHDYRAFGLLSVGSVLLIVGRFWFTEPVLGWLAFAMILSATAIQIVQSRRVCSQDIFKI